MGIELTKIGVELRKGVIFAIRGCFRFVCSHPFLVGLLCFLIFLYRSSPFIFSLLVSTSPILVCTAVLLGTLLSYGQPNIPEIEIEEKQTTILEATPKKTDVSEDDEKNERYYVERYSEKSKDEADHSNDDDAPLIEERSRDIEFHDGEILEPNGELLGGLRYKQKTEWVEERLDDDSSSSKMKDELLEPDEDEKSDAESFDSETVNVDSLDSPPRSPWKLVEEREEDEDEEGDDLDSESSGSESSSPDASLADIMPMLDELHPLLEEDENPQPVHISSGGSDAASEKSESDDEAENHEDSEVGDDDNNEDEEEEDGQEDKEEETKSAITWTEEDQKNLMDLGSSEIERNQRLENLIRRRRARKNMSMLHERNLIDLDGSDLPFNIPPISTRRQNPFDLPHDSYDNLGLPPIPGSAPSILLPRRNPFDIPYDSSEEKPNLKGDGFKEDFTASQSRETLFRRHESFNVRPSFFRQDVRMRPYFVPEGTVSEESSYSPFQRQSSEVSESKVSSVPETESIGSVEDLEDRKLPEEEDDLQEEVEAIPWTNKEVTEDGSSLDQEVINQQEEDDDEDVHRELKLISESVSEHVGHGSQSSVEEDDDSLELGQVEKREVEVNELENSLEYHSSNYEALEQRYSRDSSSSSLSEESERVFINTEGDDLSMFEERRIVAEEPRISTLNSVGSTDLNITDVSQREPVYDSSPREIKKNLSSSSISSDLNPESDLGLSSHVLVKRTLPFIGREVAEGSGQEIEPEPSFVHTVDESRPTDVDVRERDEVNYTGLAGIEQRFESEGVLDAHGITYQVPIPLESSVEDSMEANVMEQHEIPDSSVNKNIIQEVIETSEDENLVQPRETYLSTARESVIEAIEPQLEGQLREEQSIGMRDTVQSPNSDANVCHKANEKSLFYDKEIQEPEHHIEVQESTISIESSEDVQIDEKFNVPEIQELDHDMPTNINPQLSPDFISIPSSATETASSHIDVQTITDDTFDIKEIDEGLLSELDNVGDFSTRQWGSGSSEFDKHIDSVGEIYSSKINSVEEIETENALHFENSREDTDAYIEDEHKPVLQTSETTKHMNVSRMEFDERDGQGSSAQGKSEDHETLPNTNEVLTLHSVVDQDNITATTVLELRSTEDVDSVSEKEAELTSVTTVITEGGADSSSYQPQNDTHAISGKLEEAKAIEDINLAFKQASAQEIESTVVLEPPQADYFDDMAVYRTSGHTHETLVLDATLANEQSNKGHHQLPDSVDRTLHVVNSEETQEPSFELPMPSDNATTLHAEQVLDHEKLKQQKLDSDNGLAEVKADEVSSSVEETSKKEIGAFAAEKPDHEGGEVPKELHSTKSSKGKGKVSKSSSSSSSSESSSSDSDKE